ncbi:MAG: protein phosphatase 2C family protein [Planctomycetota bacterium]|nr:protein phosphatase 2C family protein [Planctomycetota bacterium]
MLRAAQAVEAGSRDEDRVGVFEVAGTLVMILADGAGGRGGGREAAEAVVAGVESRSRELGTRGDSLACVAALRAIDQELGVAGDGGEATAVLAVVRAGTVFGASVGDSGAWLLARDEVVDLTRDQVRKPMVGLGRASPVAFGPRALDPGARLLLASDGLLKYSPRERIVQTALGQPLTQAVWSLIECVRLPSGGLHDDTAVILLADHA